VVRTDECDLNDIVSSALAAAHAPFAALYKAGTRAMTKARPRRPHGCSLHTERERETRQRV
jgi:hypothetical protein